MSKPIFSAVDLDVFTGLDRLGLRATGQCLEPDRVTLACEMTEAGDELSGWCAGCGGQAVPAGFVTRDLARVPYGWRPTMLHVRVRRWRCPDCRRVWRQPIPKAAPARGRLTVTAVTWALAAVVIDRVSIARAAAHLGVSWHTVNTAVAEAGRRLLIDDPHRFDKVSVIGVDEHVWRHTPHGDKYVTVIIDLTPIRDRTGQSRLLEMIPGRSRQVLADWLAAQSQDFRDAIEVVAMDGFTGFTTAATEQLPDAIEVLDPFHVVALAGGALDRCRQRVQQNTLGRRGRQGDPLYQCRRALRSGLGILTDRTKIRLSALFDDPAHAPVTQIWGVYQDMITAYRHPDRGKGRKLLTQVIDTISKYTKTMHEELATLGKTMTRRTGDILAYFDLPGTSNGPTEAINGRLEHLRGTALGFRNLTNYITRSLLDTGGLRHQVHSLLR